MMRFAGLLVCLAACGGTDYRVLPNSGGTDGAASLTNPNGSTGGVSGGANGGGTTLTDGSVIITTDAATCVQPNVLCNNTDGGTYCTNVSTDISNCGACGNVCQSGTSCVSSACQ